MRNFIADHGASWSSPGSRPHLMLPVDARVTMMSAATSRVLDDWWHTEHPDHPGTWREVQQLVAPGFLHITLGWVDEPTASRPSGQLDELAHALSEQFAEVDPFSVRVGPIRVLTVALNFFVEPGPRLARIAAMVRATLRAVFGETARPAEPTRPWRPHIATAYCVQAIPTDLLGGILSHAEDPDTGQLLGTHPMPICSVQIVDQDTFHPDGLRWDPATVRTVPLGTRRGQAIALATTSSTISRCTGTAATTTATASDGAASVEVRDSE